MGLAAVSMSTAAESTVSKKARRYLKALAKSWGQPWLSTLRVEINPRLSRAAGRWVSSSRVLELNRNVARRTARVQREILCHEAAHAVVSRRHRRAARPHGAEWAALVASAGFEPRSTLIACGTRAAWPRTRAIFNHICTVCHFHKQAKRRMPRWRCPDCRAVGLKGLLHIERVSSVMRAQ